LNVFSVSVGGWQQGVATASPRTWKNRFLWEWTKYCC